MKTLALILLTFLAYACTATLPAEPPQVECIDYSGNAIPHLNISLFTAEFVTGYNFIGDLSGTFMQTDSGQVLTATLTGTFEPSLGDRTKLFTKTGSLTMQGVFTEENGEYMVDLQVMSGTGGFEGITDGNLYLSWPSDLGAEDKTIYYVGTLCLEPNLK